MSSLSRAACGQGQLAVQKWLLEMGANAIIKNNAGDTAKDLARRFGHLASLQLMHEATAARGISEDQLSPEEEEEEEEEGGGSYERPSREFLYSGVYSSDAPAAGGLHSDSSLRFSPPQMRAAEKRARKRVDEAERLLEVARENFEQLGGRLKVSERTQRGAVRSKMK